MKFRFICFLSSFSEYNILYNKVKNTKHKNLLATNKMNLVD